MCRWTTGPCGSVGVSTCGAAYSGVRYFSRSGTVVEEVLKSYQLVMIKVFHIREQSGGLAPEAT